MRKPMNGQRKLSNAAFQRTGSTSHQRRIAALGPSANRPATTQHTGPYRSSLTRRVQSSRRVYGLGEQARARVLDRFARRYDPPMKTDFRVQLSFQICRSYADLLESTRLVEDLGYTAMFRGDHLLP